MASSEIVISAVTYPLGNDADEPTGFLKYTVLNNILQSTGMSVAESITRGYLTGRGLQLRNIFRYGRDHYAWRLPTSGLSYSPVRDTAPLTAILQALHPGTTIQYHGVDVGSPVMSYWGLRYISAKYGYDVDTGTWYNPPPGVHPNAVVTFSSAPVFQATDVFGAPMGIGPAFVQYTNVFIIWQNPDGTTGLENYYPNQSYFPSSYGTDLQSHAQSDTLYQGWEYIQARYKTVKTYPTTTTKTTRATLTGDTTHTTVTTATSNHQGEVTSKTTTVTMTVAGGTTTIKTEVATVVTSKLQYYLYYVDLAAGKPGYQASLASWIDKTPTTSPFWPSVPLRINSVDMTTPDKRDTALYKTSKKLLKKAGVDILELAGQINDNPNVDDIDYAYIMFGVPIDGDAPECKRYLYEFMKRLQGLNPGDITDPPYDPDNGDYYHPQMCSLHIYYPNTPHDAPNIKLRWAYIVSHFFSGQIAVGAKPGDIVVAKGAHATKVFTIDNNHEVTEDNSVIYIRKQVDADSYEELEIRGLVYNNLIYGGQWNVVPAWDQLNDPDNVNGFIVPLDQDLLDDLSIIITTDLAYHITHIVFNCYTIVKQKWYQTNWFKYLLIVVAIVITVMSWGSDGGSSLGYALAYSAVAATGITGVLLTFLAHVLYAIAMMIISNIIARISVKLFGDKWGMVIAAIVSIAVASYASTGSWTAGFTGGATELSAQAIINASSAVVKIGEAYLKGEMADLQDQAAALQTEEKLRMQQIEDLVKELDSQRHTDTIDIQGLTESTFHQFFESMDTFLGRTLMTGSDVAEVTNGMITNFAEVGLRLPTT